tara:strand:+ start:323 stop:772 length:450 start_codon:yes stop_codon:yes gene_type:complete
MKLALHSLLVALALSMALPAQGASEPPDINTQRAKMHYMLNCQGCHQADGRGLQGSVPDMRNFVGKFLDTPGGREFLVQVPGSANSPLSDAALAELLNWILITMSFTALPGNFRPYSAAEVEALRTQTLVDVDARRAELVLTMEIDSGD